MLIRSPDVTFSTLGDSSILENSETRLTFTGASSRLCTAIWSQLDLRESVEEIAGQTGYSARSVSDFLAVLSEDHFALDTGCDALLDADAALALTRRCAAFWNRHVMTQPFPRLLFSGQATPSHVLGWGIEFHIFVKAARDYMARGASRIDGPTPALRGLWDHFVDEAFHDAIFREGLIGCGVPAGNIDNRIPLPSTTALLNHLWEAAEDGDLAYASVFALMQPLTEPPSEENVRARYAFLKEVYPDAAPLFDAFEQHDLIDASLEHASLTIEPLLRARGGVSRHEMTLITQTIQRTADCFDLFFAGIQSHYRNRLTIDYRQIPRIDAMLPAEA